jgi:hypothetical protein
MAVVLLSFLDKGKSHPATMPGSGLKDMHAALTANNVGVGHMERLEFKEAVEAFEEVVRLEPDWRAGHTNLAFALMNSYPAKYAYRARIAGGWLIFIWTPGRGGLTGVTFYPDPGHTWDGEPRRAVRVDPSREKKGLPRLIGGQESISANNHRLTNGCSCLAGISALRG